MGDLPGQQEAECILQAGIVGDVDEALIDDFRPCLGGDVGAQIASRIADAVDIGRGPGNARRIDQRGTAAIEDRGGMAFAALRDLGEERPAPG